MAQLDDWRDEQWRVDYLEALALLCTSDEFHKINPPVKDAQEYFKAQYIGMHGYLPVDHRPTAAEIRFHLDQAQAEIRPVFTVPSRYLADQRTIIERRRRAEEIRKLIDDTDPNAR